MSLTLLAHRLQQDPGVSPLCGDSWCGTGPGWKEASRFFIPPFPQFPGPFRSSKLQPLLRHHTQVPRRKRAKSYDKLGATAWSLQPVPLDYAICLNALGRQESTKKNDAHAFLQGANEVKEGDGTSCSLSIARGVRGDYEQ
ncbi:unnamed protein product [Pleuronectes platessa]|uniref:Uncharacterized protein n=1 Tax=Pleuronectes platessa TaxID=8262 RepID=A0A9N7Y9E2_PLEPL|nr:unnamed protein product [Pleuronectes platessa]